MSTLDEPPVVLWRDEHGLAAAKPAGLLTQPTGRPGGDPDTLEGRVRRLLRPDDPASAYLGTVHRLDRPVSGVVLWALTPRAARRWSAEFAGRRAIKQYRAIVGPVGDDPTPLPRSGTFRDRIGRPGGDGRAPIFGAADDRPDAVEASTRFEILARPDEGLVRVALWPETGRTHQLRAQLAARGWPIVGDATYGSSAGFGAGIALHARSLTIEHPGRREPIRIEAPWPDSWAAFGGEGRG